MEVETAPEEVPRIRIIALAMTMATEDFTEEC